MTQPKTDESFEAIAAKRMNGTNSEYWQNACMEACRNLKITNYLYEMAGVQVRLLKEQRERLEGEVNSLEVELNSMREQRDQAQKEAKNLRGKLVKPLVGDE